MIVSDVVECLNIDWSNVSWYLSELYKVYYIVKIVGWLVVYFLLMEKLKFDEVYVDFFM